MNIREFYDADPARRESEEDSFGDGWTTERDQHSTYRASYLRDTGELYVVREPHPGGLFARFLDEFDVDQADIDELTVELIGRFDDETAAQKALAGWPDAMLKPDSLTWLYQRCPT